MYGLIIQSFHSFNFWHYNLLVTSSPWKYVNRMVIDKGSIYVMLEKNSLLWKNTFGKDVCFLMYVII